MATLKITQKKSRIGATERQGRNLDALGLRKVNQSVLHEDSPIIMGMIEKVRHLVVVEAAQEAKPKKEAAPKAVKEEAVKAEVPAVKKEAAPKAEKAEKPAVKKAPAVKKEAAPKAAAKPAAKKAPAKPKAEKKEA